MNREPFKKSLQNIPKEEAHGGSGARQLLLSAADPITANLQAMTKGFLPAGAMFDWHNHEGIDELFLVQAGSGEIEFENDTKLPYVVGDLIYIPAGLHHRICNKDTVENEFIFLRVSHNE